MDFRAFIKRRGIAFKALVALIGPTATVLTTLLALGVIHPLGAENALAKAAATTSAARSSELILSVRMGETASDRDGDSEFTAQGEFDYRTQRGRLVYDFSHTAGLEFASSVPAVFSQRLFYMKFPESLLPGERRWVRADLDQIDQLRRDLAESDGAEAQQVDLSFLSQLEFSDPSEALDSLAASSDVEKLEKDSLSGVETTVYKGRLDLHRNMPPAATGQGQAQASMPGLAVKAWIDEDDRIRQLKLFPENGSQAFEMTLAFDNFGVRVEAPPPPPSKVIDIGKLLLQS